MNYLLLSLSAVISMACVPQDEEMPKEFEKEKMLELFKKIKPKISDEKRGFLGINVGKDEDDEKVEIKAVNENSPAEKAGLQEGDKILAVDKTDISDPQELIDYLKEKKPGQTVTLKIERDGKEKSVKVVLGKRNEDGTVIPVDPADAKLDSVYNELFDQTEKIKKLIEKAEKDGAKDEVELLTSILNSINKLKIKTLLKDLGSKDENKRETARKILLNMGEDAIKELEKDSSDEAKKLLKELEELKGQIKKFIEDLGNDNADTRDKAEKELVKFGKPALPYLKEATNDKDTERAARAKKIIEEIEGKNSSSKPPKKKEPKIEDEFPNFKFEFKFPEMPKEDENDD